MNTTERRDALLEATETEHGFSTLRRLVIKLVEDGISTQILIEDMENIRGLLSETDEDIMLDVMDQITGYCSPQVRLFPRPLPTDPDYGMR